MDVVQPDYEPENVTTMIMQNMCFQERNVDWIDNTRKDGDGMSVPPTLPRHPLTSGHQQHPTGSPSPHTKPGAYCYWKDAVREELCLSPFADQEDEFAVVASIKANMGVEICFDLRVICDKPSSFTRYVKGTDGGVHIYHKLPKSLANLLSSKSCRVVMYNHKMMCAFYNSMGHHFIGGELYTGCFGCEPAGDKYCCTDWMLMSKQIFGTVLDQDITGTVIMDMPALETLKIPKTSAACFVLDGKPKCMSENSHFHLKTSKPGAVHDKPNEHSLCYDPRTKNMHMAQVASKALCTLQAIHHSICLT